VASGSVIGSGLGRKGSTVRWRAIGKIGVTWLLTLPAAAMVGGLAALLIRAGTVGIVVVAVIGLSAIVVMFVLSQREAVDHSNAISDVDAVGGAMHIPSKKERDRLAAKANAARKVADKAAKRAAETGAARVAAQAALDQADTAVLKAMTKAAAEAQLPKAATKAAPKPRTREKATVTAKPPVLETPTPPATVTAKPPTLAAADAQAPRVSPETEIDKAELDARQGEK
jgi:PiT family inorganic phosphate transporter